MHMLTLLPKKRLKVLDVLDESGIEVLKQQVMLIAGKNNH